MEAGLDCRLFSIHLKQLELFGQGTKRISSGRIAQWRSTWREACDELFNVSRADLLRYGMLLGRLAETASFPLIAEEVFNRLADSAAQREQWIANPGSVLITAGEFNRRAGNLDNAESRYREALTMLERELPSAGARQQIHLHLGRLFYELAYLHRLRGDSYAARSMLERSEVECGLAEDEVGVEIARTLLAVISYEEGFAETAISGLTACVSRLSRLATDLEIAKSDRSDFARRWVVNAQAHLAKAHLASGNHEAARQLLELVRADPLTERIGQFWAQSFLTEALLLLAQGQIDLALCTVDSSWKSMEQYGTLMSTELAAAPVAIAGVIHCLRGSKEAWNSAHSCFEQACMLPPNLHNRRAQAWAWAGRAILAKKAGNSVACLDAVHNGLANVERCGAPIRSFLLALLRNSRSTANSPDLYDLKNLVVRCA